jgi:hypothetical protein
MVSIDFDTSQSVDALLRVVSRRAKSAQERAQVAWWVSQVAELRKQQPSAEPVPADQAHELQPTGTGGGR